MKTNPVHQSETVLPHIGITDFFDLQAQYQRSIFQHYDKAHTHSELVKHAVEGSIKLIDALVLRDLLISTKPNKILEVGTFLGFSLEWILNSTAFLSSKVTSLDPRVRHRIFDDVKSHVVNFTSKHSHRVSFIDAYLSERNDEMFLYDYLNREPKMNPTEAMSLLREIPVLAEPFANFDFAFIDGDHSYNATLANTSLVARMMPSGGYIVVHDAISWPEVRPALEALCKVNGLTFVKVLGEDFYQRFGQDRNFYGFCRTLCDGLALIRVAPGATIKGENIEPLMRAPMFPHGRDSSLRKIRRRILGAFAKRWGRARSGRLI